MAFLFQCFEDFKIFNSKQIDLFRFLLLSLLLNKSLLNKYFLFLSIVILSSCVSVKKYNKQLETPISIDKLKSDVDFAYLKLKKLHPNLYWYISEKTLTAKFDSLKITIAKPLNPSAFYSKLAPVISQIREGHLRLVAPVKRLTKREIRDRKDQKGLFSRFNFSVDKNRLFVLDNDDNIANMEVGTELLSINGENTSALLKRYSEFVNSDGFNTTFQKYYLAKAWPRYFRIEKGIQDSVLVETQYDGALKSFYLYNELKTKAEKKTEKTVVKSKQKLQKNQDYNARTREYNRDLKFLKADSSIAVISIKTFSGYRSKKFYKESFATLKKSKAKYLIVDIRNNFGGSLAEISNLYSYLGANKFPFINDIKIVSPASIFHADYLTYYPTLAKPLGIITYPLYFIGTAFAIKKKDNGYFLRNNGAFSIKKAKDDQFKGKIYVLINGGSFSASSIISSKLKGDKRATLIGEETGGANDGTVAGRYSTEKLSNSKLVLPIGLMSISPNIDFTNTKKGVTPDIKMIPTINEVLQKKDIVLEKIISEIEAE